MPSAFPTTILDFKFYLDNVTKYLTEHSVRLGIDPDNLAELLSLYGNKTTPDTYLWCFAKWCDKGSGKTQVINLKLRNISASLKITLSEIFNDIPASKWTIDDRKVLNRKKGLPYIKTSHEAPIEEKLFIFIEPRQYGLFWITIRPGSETGRCHIPSGADSVEVAYAILENNIRVNTENNPMVRKTCIGPEDNTQRHVSFQSRFFFKAGSMLTGYTMQIWFRWAHSRHPKRAGSWTVGLEVLVG